MGSAEAVETPALAFDLAEESGSASDDGGHSNEPLRVLVGSGVPEMIVTYRAWSLRGRPMPGTSMGLARPR